LRTTLTLDDDVAARLNQLREEWRLPFKQLVNDLLRRGLAALDTPPRGRQKSPTSPVSLGPLTPDVDDIAEVLALAEGERRR
jgi:hypothetical protein